MTMNSDEISGIVYELALNTHETELNLDLLSNSELHELLAEAKSAGTMHRSATKRIDRFVELVELKLVTDKEEK